MKPAQRIHVEADGSGVTDIPLQAASLDIWDSKYRLKKRDGALVDRRIDETYRRVARAIADVETTDELRAHWHKRFLWALHHGAIPAGRIVSNAGALEHKPATSTINCTVSGTILDSMDDILDKVHEAGLTLKAGCGIGYEFSTLRPKGAYVTGAGAYTSGPLSFMDIYDRMCFTVSSAGGRRGAQMATFDVGHPDILDFIRAKREDGRLRQFNLSLLITREFMEAVRDDAQWKLAFPLMQPEVEHDGIDLGDPESVVWRSWPVHDGYVTNDLGKVACRVYRSVRARRIWDVIMSSTYDFAEPGIHPDRRNQRHEQQLVLRKHSRDQPLRRAAPSAVRFMPARLGQSHPVRARPIHGPRTLRLGDVPRGRRRFHPHARQRRGDQRTPPWPSHATRSCKSGATGWAIWASARP